MSTIKEHILMLGTRIDICIYISIIRNMYLPAITSARLIRRYVPALAIERTLHRLVTALINFVCISKFMPKS